MNLEDIPTDEIVENLFYMRILQSNPQSLKLEILRAIDNAICVFQEEIRTRKNNGT